MDAKLAGQIAADAYISSDGKTFKPLPSGWVEDEDFQTGYSDNMSGAFRVLVNASTHEIVFDFKGSTTLNDWESDILNNGRSVIDQIVPLAMDSLSKIKDKYPGYNIISVGHSLGGGEAQTFALEAGVDNFVFDSLPISSHSLNDLAKAQGISVDECLANYRAAGHKSVSTFLNGEVASWWYNSVQGCYYLDTSPTEVPSQISTGSIGAFSVGARFVNPFIGLLSFLGIKGYGHLMGNLNDAMSGLSVDPSSGRVISSPQPNAPSLTLSSNSSGTTRTLTIKSSNGDQYTTSISGTSGTLSGSGGKTGTLQLDAAGHLASDTWQKPDGTHGTDEYHSDGSVVSKTYFALGGYTSTSDDGHGNIETQYFTDKGIAYRDTWVHADGSTGSTVVIQDGRVSALVTSDNSHIMGDTVFRTSVNADGSGERLYNNGDTNAIVTQFGTDGAVVKQATGVWMDYFAANNVDPSKTTKNGDVTEYFNSDGTLLEKDTVNGDGSTKQENSYTSGATRVTTVNADQSRTVVDTSRNGDRTNLAYDKTGVLKSDTFSLSDGATGGLDGVATPAAAKGTITYAGGAISKFNFVQNGDFTVDNFNGSTKTSEDVLHADGTQTTTVYNQDGSSSKYSYDTHGHVTIDDLSSSGALVDEQTVAAGSVVVPDGNSLGIGKTQNGSELAFTASTGDSIQINLDSSGEFLYARGISDSSTDSYAMRPDGSSLNPDQTKGIGGYLTFTDLAGSSYTFGGNEQTKQKDFLPADLAADTRYNSWTGGVDYYSTSQQLTGFAYGQQSGAHGYVTFNTDGSQTQSFWGTDGSHVEGTIDASGNYSRQDFDASGNLIRDSWTKSDGTKGADVYNSDGSSKGSTYAADGSNVTYTDDGKGDVTNSNINAQGTVTSDTWQQADGSTGTDTYSADGSSSGGTQYADATSSSYTDDGKGNKTTTYFDATGVKTKDSWTKSDGSSGTDTYDATGFKIADTWHKADGSSESDTIDSSGLITGTGYAMNNGVLSPTTFSDDGKGNTTLSFGDGIGNIIRTDWHKADGSSGEDNVYPNTKTHAADDGKGNRFTTTVTTCGNFLEAHWYKADGSHGDDYRTYYDVQHTYASGDYGNATAGDGSYSTYVVDAHANRRDTYFTAANGTKLRDTWTHTNGDHGTDTFNADGSSTGTSTLANGSYTTYTNTGNGSITINSYDAQNTLQSSVTSNVATVTNADGSYVVTLDDGAGNTCSTTYNAACVKLSDTWSKANGTSGSDAFNDVDGSATGKTQYADGTYSLYTFDGRASLKTTLYSAAGDKLSDTWTDGTNSGADTFNADGSSTGTETQPGGYVQAFSNDGKGNTSTKYYQNSVLQEIDYTYADGSYSNDTYAADGSMSGQTYYPDGSYAKFTQDVAGNYFWTKWDNCNNKISDTWTKTDGTSGSDTFNGDGSSTGKTTNADGSYSIDTSNGSSTVFTTQYSTTGVKLSDSWTRGDGSHGTDTFNADGSSNGTTVLADGSSTNYANTGKGSVTINSYDAGGTLLGSVTSSITKVTNADGSYITTIDDGAGNTSSTTYNAADIKQSDVWTKSDGTTGSDTYNTDGTSSGKTQFTDGTYALYTHDGGAGLTTTLYSAAGVALSNTWTDGMGDSGANTLNADGSSSGTQINADGTSSAYFSTTANDTVLQGTNYDTTYRFMNGIGHDTINPASNVTNPDKTDTLQFGWEVDASTLSVHQNGNDLVIAAGNGSITLTNWYAVSINGSSTQTIKTLQFADGTSMTMADLLAGPTQPAATTAALDATARVARATTIVPHVHQIENLGSRLLTGAPVGDSASAVNAASIESGRRLAPAVAAEAPIAVSRQVDALVQAMASFAPSGAISTSLRSPTSLDHHLMLATNLH